MRSRTDAEPLYARRYVRQRHRALRCYHLWMARKRASLLCALTPIAAGDRVLEIGCDTGVLLRELLRSGASVEGVDLNPEAVQSCDGLNVQVAGAEQLPFPDEHFDCVVASHVIEHVRDHERMLREASRVLRPSGCLVLWYPFELFRGMTVLPELLVAGRPIALARAYHLHRFSPRGLRAPSRRAELVERAWRWCVYGPVPEFMSVYFKKSTAHKSKGPGKPGPSRTTET